MSAISLAWDHPSVRVAGALEVRATAGGISPRRLPAWTEAQSPDPALMLMAGMTSGVRLVVAAAATRIELDVLETGLRFAGQPRRPIPFDLVTGGRLVARAFAEGGPNVVVDGARRPPTTHLEPGEASTVVFDGLDAAPAIHEIWLPHAASVDLRGLRVDGEPADLPAPSARRWAHYGSSISHGMEAEGPSETWPAVAARMAGVELTSLGFAGQCHLDSLVARSLRDADVDLISLKLGINLINGDTMRERVFIASVHGFLDTIRDGKPATPILVISPILCPAVEDHPGPTLNDGQGVYAPPRPEVLRPGALTTGRIRRLLRSIVRRRREAGDAALFYLDGLDLFGEADLADLPDGLHPNAAGLRRMGERFAALAFATAGPFAATEPRGAS